MSAVTKRKYVEQEIDDKLFLPSENDMIVRVIVGKGNNLHSVENASGQTFLVSMPTKFRKNVWIKRGDYLLCIPIEEGDKVRGEIAHVLYKDNIAYIQENGLWPEQFKVDSLERKTKDDNVVKPPIDDDMLPPSDSDSDSEIAVCNPNYQRGIFTEDRDESSDSDQNEL